MGQFRITQEDGLANKIAYLRNQLKALKEKQPIGLNQSEMNLYTTGTLNSKLVNLAGTEYSQCDLWVTFKPNNNKPCVIIPQGYIEGVPGGGGGNGQTITEIKAEDGEIFYKVFYSWQAPAGTNFTFRLDLYTSCKGAFIVEER